LCPSEFSDQLLEDRLFPTGHHPLMELVARPMLLCRELPPYWLAEPLCR
jgi:hypothetical protein